MSRASVSTVTVDYATSDGTGESPATAGEDYEATSGTLTFAPGETAKTVSVPILDDPYDEGEGDPDAHAEQPPGRERLPRRRGSGRNHREPRCDAAGMACTLRAHGRRAGDRCGGGTALGGAKRRDRGHARGPGARDGDVGGGEDGARRAGSEGAPGRPLALAEWRDRRGRQRARAHRARPAHRDHVLDDERDAGRRVRGALGPRSGLSLRRTGRTPHDQRRGGERHARRGLRPGACDVRDDGGPLARRRHVPQSGGQRRRRVDAHGALPLRAARAQPAGLAPGGSRATGAASLR